MGWGSIVVNVPVVFHVTAMSAPANAQCTGTSGRVVDHLTGLAIAGARAFGGIDSNAVTDAEGCFVLNNVYTEDCIPGHIDCGYQFSVYADGYVPYGEYGYRSPPGTGRFYASVRLAPIAAALCSGDCEDDFAIGIDELLCAVDALLAEAASECTCADADGDGSVHIAEILGVVHNARIGRVDCGPLSPDACVQLYAPDSVMAFASAARRHARIQELRRLVRAGVSSIGTYRTVCSARWGPRRRPELDFPWADALRLML